MTILSGIVFVVDCTFQDGLAHIFVENYVEFRELSNDFLRLLGLLYKPLPLSLQIFHNNFNLCNFMPTNKSFRYRVWNERVSKLNRDHVKAKAMPLKFALFPFWILKAGEEASNLLLGLVSFSTVERASAKNPRAVLSFSSDLTRLECRLTCTGVSLFNFLYRVSRPMAVF